MPLLRPSAALVRLTRTRFNPRTSMSIQPLSTTSRLSAASGYGDPNGADPKSSAPQEQGASNSTKHDAEHPGPAPPSEGHNTGSATKAYSSGSGEGKSPSDASAQSGGARSKEAKETGSSPTGGAIGGGKRSFSTSSKFANEAKESGKGKGGAQPKISDQSEPGKGLDKEKAAEVEQHNKEFEKGHDRAAKAEPDKVDEKFWKGQGGHEKV